MVRQAYGTGRWVGLEVTDILPLWGSGYGGSAGRRLQSDRCLWGRWWVLNLNLGWVLLWANLNPGGAWLWVNLNLACDWYQSADF